MLRSLLTTTALVTGLAVAVPASAGLVVQDGDGGMIPREPLQEQNDVVGEVTTTSPNGFGANISYDAKTHVKFTFLGFEAGFDNDFNVNGNTVFSNKGGDASAVGDMATFVFGSGTRIEDGVPDGPLPFSFVSGGSGFGTVDNGSNPSDNDPSNPTGVNFFVAPFDDLSSSKQNDFAEYGLGSGDFIAAFDDNGGGNDDNHDDMVVGVQAVPVPATFGLLGVGLLGLGVAMRRREET